MGEPMMMEPRLVEDRALKNMLRPTDFMQEIAIPRAKVKRFPSNVSNFRRSASSRAPSRLNRITYPQPLSNGDANQFKTVPIDIATLVDNPAPKVPVTRGVGRSYSNRSENVHHAPPAAKQPRDFRQQSYPPPNGGRNPLNGGGSFLYSGNYDPHHPNQPIITKPVPLSRSNSKQFKNDPPVSRQNQNRNNKQIGNRNPLVLAEASNSTSIMEIDEVDFGEGGPNEFDNWADDMFNNNYSKPGPASGGAVVVGAKIGQNKKGNSQAFASKTVPSAQQNWVLAGGPSSSRNNEDIVGTPPIKDKKGGFKNLAKDAAKDAAKEAAMDAAKEGMQSILAEGGFDPSAMGDGLVSGLGGKLGSKAGGKLGGALGKKLGNEEMGAELGEMIGDELGSMAADMAKDAAKDAAMDALAGEGLAPPEVPDMGKLASKCVIM